MTPINVALRIFAPVTLSTVEVVKTESFQDSVDVRDLLKDQSESLKSFLQFLVRIHLAFAVLKFQHHFGEALKKTEELKE